MRTKPVNHKQKFLARAVLMVWLGATSLLCSAEDGTADWQLKKAEDGIEVYSQPLSNSHFHRVKGVTIVTTELKSLLSFLQDESINTQWVPYSGGAELLQRKSSRESIVHFYVKSSWPFKDRDAVALFTVNQDPGNYSVHVAMSSLPDYIPQADNTVRMEQYQGYWQLAPLGDGRIRITYLNHIDPGGNIPSWIANPFAVKATWQALANLKQAITGYDKVAAHLDFIQEPP